DSVILALNSGSRKIFHDRIVEENNTSGHPGIRSVDAAISKVLFLLSQIRSYRSIPFDICIDASDLAIGAVLGQNP
ncbi:hypothetical protein KI387_000474, partial [Taxus chinensis]